MSLTSCGENSHIKYIKYRKTNIRVFQNIHGKPVMKSLHEFQKFCNVLQRFLSVPYAGGKKKKETASEKAGNKRRYTLVTVTRWEVEGCFRVQ